MQVIVFSAAGLIVEMPKSAIYFSSSLVWRKEGGRGVEARRKVDGEEEREGSK